MDISIIVPLYNEAESLPKLYEWIVRVMKEHGYTYEILFVNDGSADESWQVIESLAEKSHSKGNLEGLGNVHGMSFRPNYGKSAALYCGLQAAQG